MYCINPKTTKAPQLWALVDCNSFYCSCERLFRPELEGKPVVVLSNNDGCLIALTPEAKSLGYKMGDVYFQLEHRLRWDKVTVFSSNYTLYGDISNRVMQTMESLVRVEQYSIDEAFVPMDSTLAVQADEVGWALHDRVKKWVGVPVRVGIGSTRTLAKLANHWAKRKTRVYRLEAKTPECEEALENTPTEDIWGIGRRQSAKLANLGIRTAKQLRDMDAERARKLLTIVGERTVLELRGHQCIMEDDAPVPRKTLISSRSFGRRVFQKEDLSQALAMHCTLAGERLRAEGILASGLSVHMQTSMHDPDNPYFSASATVSLPIPTNVTGELIRAAGMALDKCYAPGHGFMKGGILLFDLSEENNRQLSLLEVCRPRQDARKVALMRCLDMVNNRYGRDTMRYLSQGPSDAFWHMQRKKKSPNLTTRWNELPQIRL